MSAASSPGHSRSVLAPSPKLGSLDSHGHSVQFYSDDSFLLEELSRFIGSALGAGDAGIVIGTKAHREGIALRLKALGLEIVPVIQQGRYIALDAAETLSKFMLNGWPDPARFAEVMGSAIAQAKAASQGEQSRVAVFGEMVALLWADGNPAVAMRLEELWNDLAKTQSFRLHCAYPMNLFRLEGDGEPVLKICAEHSQIIPDESYTSLSTEEERLQSIIFLQQKAQALETEIAERKKAQRHLQQREAELTDFLENAVIGMHWVASDGRILWANKAEMDLLGYSREEYIGRHISEFHADEPVIEDILQRLSRNEELHGHQARLQCKDGSIRHVRIDSNVFMQDGKFVHTRCFTTDITEQRNAEEARAKLAAIVECSDDAIAGKDLNGIVTSWNASAEQIFGYKAEEIIGRPITQIIPPELQSEEQFILDRIKRGEKIDHFETIRLTKSGERLEVSLSISPIKVQHGTVVGAAKIVRNITESKKIERALRITEKLASVGRLAATVAHEINNPLEALTNLIYLAKIEISDSAKAERHLELANHELHRVAHIARQTLGFYRDTTSPSGMSAGQTLDDLLFLYAAKLDSRRIVVLKQYEGALQVEALAGEIRQAFSNLIANAIDAMPAGGVLTLRASKSREWDNANLPGIRVTIADTGSGIDAATMQHLFEPFYTTKKDVGTGLGLWITRGIIEKHRGKIRVRSKTEGTNRGTVFSLFLPETCNLKEDTSSLAPTQLSSLSQVI